MKATELISKVSALIAEHGDLEIFYDADSVLTESASVALLDCNDPYLGLSVFVICSSTQKRNPGITMVRD